MCFDGWGVSAAGVQCQLSYIDKGTCLPSVTFHKDVLRFLCSFQCNDISLLVQEVACGCVFSIFFTSRFFYGSFAVGIMLSLCCKVTCRPPVWRKSLHMMQ